MCVLGVVVVVGYCGCGGECCVVGGVYCWYDGDVLSYVCVVDCVVIGGVLEVSVGVVVMCFRYGYWLVGGCW